MTRQATGEGDIDIPLALRRKAIWRGIGTDCGEQLVDEGGFLAIEGSGGTALRHGRPGFFDTTVEVGRRFGIAHELLTPDAVMARYPAFRLNGDERCYFEPGGGVVFPERIVAAQCRLAAQAGAGVNLGEVVQSIVQSDDHVTVRTDRADYPADRIVVAAGAWTPGLFSKLLAPLRVLREVMQWFEAAPLDFQPRRFPTFIWPHGSSADDSFYGFPILAGCTPALKVAAEQFSNAVGDLARLDRTVTMEETAAMFIRHVSGPLSGAHSHAVKASACLYTHSPDGHFVIDRHPDFDRIMLASACSGHGFKHSAAVGEHIAAVLTGAASLEPAFAIDRPILGKLAG